MPVARLSRKRPGLPFCAEIPCIGPSVLHWSKRTGQGGPGRGTDVSIFGYGQVGADVLPRGMGCVVPLYRPRDAEHTVLHQVISEHLETFLNATTEGATAWVCAVRRARVPGIPAVRRVRGRRRAVSVRGLRARAPGAVFRVKGAGGVRAVGAVG